VCAAAAAALLAACGGGPPAEEVRARVEAVCDAHAADMPPVRPVAGAAPRAEDLLRMAFRVNASDAALDAVDAGGAQSDRIDDLRAALRAVRGADMDLRWVLLRGGPADAVQAAERAGVRAYARVDGAASALGARRCAADRLGRPAFTAIAAGVAQVVRRAQPTGDLAADLTGACRELPDDLTVPAGAAADPGAQETALVLRQGLQAFRAEVARLSPTEAQRPVLRRALADAADAEDLLLGYVEAVGVSDADGSRRLAGEVSAALGRMRTRLAALGARC
jgi:hypothetical protein